MSDPDPKEPFDETAAPRQRRRCFFCESVKSDEWHLVARLNAFVCKNCFERVNEIAPPRPKAEDGA